MQQLNIRKIKEKYQIAQILWSSAHKLIILHSYIQKKKNKLTPLAITTPATTGTRAAYVTQASLLKVIK